MTIAAIDRQANRINLSWLLKLRWGAIAGQIVILLVVELVLGITLPVVPLFAIIALELGSNIGFVFWLRNEPVVEESVLALLMAGDVLLFTCLLFVTGGPFNPFSFLYLVHIALATVVLRTRWTWGLCALSFACFGALFIQGSHAGHEHHMNHDGSMQMHMQGMWLAFGVAAAFIVYFVTRVTRDLARREEELAHARALASRGEKLASLATLAAGAAHELSTPLATIAVVARELERDLAQGASGAQKSADARVIRDVVGRCQEILVRMAADAGQSAGEGFAHLTLDELLAEALGGLLPQTGVELGIEPNARGCRLYLPRHAVTRALRDVLKNAQQATCAGLEIAVRARIDQDNCRIEVCDLGPGMSKDVLARAGEPFFTTKEPGEGMGLGLFVARSVLERIGGKLELGSSPGRGTTVVLTLPIANSRDNSPHASMSSSVET